MVGAAHINVWADYLLIIADKVDKIGKAKFAVGGTRYNIAVDLAQAGIPTSFFHQGANTRQDCRQQDPEVKLAAGPKHSLRSRCKCFGNWLQIRIAQ